MTDSADDRLEIDAALVRRMVGAQFPQWANLDVRPVEPGGWDNSTFRLGEHLSVRMPSAARYVAQVEKEHECLPRLAPLLPLSVPEPLAVGQPGDSYPWRWSVYRWIEGETVSAATVADMNGFATALAEFLRALHRVDVTEGPPPGEHNFFRGGSPAVYDGEVRRAVAALEGKIDTRAAADVWEAALAAPWRGFPVWVHGDIAAGNLLVRDGRLSAVIDFGSSAVGDPACDLAIAWTFLDRESRETFRATLPLDEATWARGRGWALWKALIMLAGREGDAPPGAAARRVIGEVLADHRLAG